MRVNIDFRKTGGTTLSLPKGTFEDEFPLTKVGYLSSLKGTGTDAGEILGGNFGRNVSTLQRILLLTKTHRILVGDCDGKRKQFCKVLGQKRPRSLNSNNYPPGN